MGRRNGGQQPGRLGAHRRVLVRQPGQQDREGGAGLAELTDGGGGKNAHRGVAVAHRAVQRRPRTA